MLARKGLFIIFLIALLGSFFYLKPLLYGEVEDPLLEDRIPEGDYLGKLYLFDLAKETNDILFYNQLPFRDMLTPDFLLAQAKSYGIDLQKPAYFFANENKEWGALIEVNDSSKILSGIVRLQKNFELKDTLISEQKIYTFPKENLYMTYGKDWLFVYQGELFPRRLYHVLYSKKGEIKPKWQQFLTDKTFKDEKLVVCANTKKSNPYGLQLALFAHDADSSTFHFKTYFKSKDSLLISQKDSGIAFKHNPNSVKSLNLHLDISKIRNNKNHPAYLWLSKRVKRISFPLDDFLMAWEGDVSFNQGGMISIQESYIESVLDDDFNVTEVKKTKETKVPGFSFLMSTNSHQKEFISKLFARGIIRKTGNVYYVLNSPPLKLNLKPEYMYCYASAAMPKTTISSGNSGTWDVNNQSVQFKLDSLNSHEIFMTFDVPALSFLKRFVKL